MSDICNTKFTFKVWPAPFRQIGCAVFIVYFYFTDRTLLWALGRVKVVK